MKLIDKHIIREFIPPLLYCIGIFICLYVIIDLFTNLDDIIKQHVKVQMLLRYYLAFLPIIFTQVTPIAVLLSTLYSLGTLNRQNEIMAMKASGISVFRIIAPLLFLGLIISLLSFIVDNKIVPKAYAIYSTIKEEKIESQGKKGEKEVIKDVALYGADYRIFYAESYNVKSKTLKRIIILQHNEKGELIARITSDTAKWLDDKWIFYKCAIYTLDKSGAISGKPLFFKEKIFRLQEKPRDFSKSKHQTQFMSIIELYKYVKKLSKDGYRPIGILIDLYNKISFPFINFIVILIGVPFALLPNRTGTLMYLGASLSIGFLYYAALITSVAMGKAGLLPAFLSSWFANIIFAVAGIIFVIKLPK